MEKPSGLSGFVWRSSNLQVAKLTRFELRLREGRRQAAFFFLSGWDVQLLLLGAGSLDDGKSAVVRQLLPEEGFEIVRQRNSAGGGSLLDALSDLE